MGPSAKSGVAGVLLARRHSQHESGATCDFAMLLWYTADPVQYEVSEHDNKMRK